MIKGKKVIDINNPPAVVLGGSAAGALGVIRDLSKKGIPVYAVESDRKQVFVYSRFCKKCICPSAKDQEREYVDYLVDLGKNFSQKAVLIPTGDIETRTILKHKEKLSSYYLFISSDFIISDVFLNKKKFYQLLEKQGISHPKTVILSDDASMDDIVDTLSFPCLLKPVFSARFSMDFHQKVFTVHSKNELRSQLKKAKEHHHEILVQEIVRCNEDDVIGVNAYIDSTFDINQFFMYQRIRSYPIKFGTSCFVKPVFIPELKERVISLVKKQRYFGFIDAEFVKDEKDGKYKLIEINPRAWMQIGYSTVFGINFPYLCYRSTIQNKDEILPEINDMNADVKKVFWLYFFYDLRASLRLIKDKRLSFKEWIASYKVPKTYGLFRLDDPLPFLVLCVLVLFQILLYPTTRLIRNI